MASNATVATESEPYYFEVSNDNTKTLTPTVNSYSPVLSMSSSKNGTLKRNSATTPASYPPISPTLSARMGGAQPIPRNQFKCNILKAKAEDELNVNVTKLMNQMFVGAEE